jgi:hypothetical protein
MNEQKEPSRAKKSSGLGPLIVLAILAAVGGLFALGIQGNKGLTTGTIQYGGSSQKPWTLDVDHCYTRRDIKPIGVTGGSHASRLFTTEKADPLGLYVIRDVLAGFGYNTVNISRGPNESPTKRDRAKLAMYKGQKWSVQLKVPGAATPIRITPEMCKRFALDSTNEISTTLPRDLDGSVDLECTTPDGVKVIAKIKYDGCP